MVERLQKFIAGSTSYSRRKAEDLMTSGRVTVNGKRVTKLGTTVDPQTDDVRVDGRVLKPRTRHRTILLHKPAGYICTKARYPDERTVYDLVPESRTLAIAGRLDKDSEGLIVLSDDGDLVLRLTHPRYRHEKEYLVTVDRRVADGDVRRLTIGVRLEEGTAKADRVERTAGTTLRFVLHQGWKRQIRRMLERLGYQTVRLIRVRVADYLLGKLKPGEWREVSD